MLFLVWPLMFLKKLLLCYFLVWKWSFNPFLIFNTIRKILWREKSQRIGQWECRVSEIFPKAETCHLQITSQSTASDQFLFFADNPTVGLEAPDPEAGWEHQLWDQDTAGRLQQVLALAAKPILKSSSPTKFFAHLAITLGLLSTCSTKSTIYEVWTLYSKFKVLRYFS